MIRFENVTKTYPRSSQPALRDVSLEVERGEFVFVVGQSGSGKSTLLRLILREEAVTSGNVLPNKNVFQNVAFALQVLGKSRQTIQAVVPESLEMVGLDGKEKRMPHELSGGEQQRVAIARAFVNRPAILLADEPTGNLDPTTSLDIVRLLDRIHRTGTTIVMATHDDEIVDQLRKRVVELDNGQLVRDQSRGVYGARR